MDKSISLGESPTFIIDFSFDTRPTQTNHPSSSRQHFRKNAGGAVHRIKEVMSGEQLTTRGRRPLNGGRRETAAGAAISPTRATRMLDRLGHTLDVDSPTLIATGHRVVYWNRAAAEFFGELLVQSPVKSVIESLIDSRDTERVATFLAAIFKPTRGFLCKTRFRLARHFSADLPCDVFITATGIEISGTRMIQLVVKPPSDRRRLSLKPAIAVLPAVRSTSGSTLEHSVDFLDVLNLPALRVKIDGTIISANRALCEFLDMDQRSLCGSEFAVYICDIESASQFTSSLRDGGVSSFEIPIRAVDDQVHVVELAIQTLPGRGADEERLVLLRDVTALKRKDLEIMDATESLRDELCMQLHDDLGFELTSVKYQIEQIRRSARMEPYNVDARIAELQQQVDALIGKFRSINKNLQSSHTDPAALAKALKELCLRVSKMSDVRCRFSFQKPKCSFLESEPRNLLKIAQEAMVNAVKHAGARSISLTLGEYEDRPFLTVKNDGRHFVPCDTTGSGMGLRLMKQRADAIGASFSIKQGPGGGAVVNCMLSARR